MEGFPRAEFKRFGNLKDAENFIGVAYIETSLTKSAQTYEDSPSPSSVSSASSSPSTSASVASAAPSTSAAARFKPYPTAISKGKANAEESTSRTIDRDEWTTAYTDGACRGNGTVGAVAGIGVWYGDNDPRYRTTLAMHQQEQSLIFAFSEMSQNAALALRQTTEPS